MPATFLDLLRQAEATSGGCLCVGLDPDADRLPVALRALPVPDAFLRFNKAIVDATAPFAAAFKLNAAFYEAYGRTGLDVLYASVAVIRERAPHTVVIVDSKRGDIGNTARFYARAAFDDLGADAITVAPYMGRDSVTPFLEHAGRCAFVLARTSNPGAQDFQHRTCEGEALYQTVVRQVVAWDAAQPGTAGLVVGATDADALTEVRRLAPDTPLLIPGVGAQGGDPATVMAAAGAGAAPLLVNSSRGILYASSTDDFAQRAADAARTLRDVLTR